MVRFKASVFTTVSILHKISLLLHSPKIDFSNAFLVSGCDRLILTKLAMYCQSQSPIQDMQILRPNLG